MTTPRACLAAWPRPALATPSRLNAWRLFAVAGGLCLGLAACGGGGGSSPTPAPPPPAPGPDTGCSNASTILLLAPAAATVGRNVEVAVAGCSTRLVMDPVWTQTAGPAVTLMSARSPAISFVAPSAGSYAFKLEYKNASGVLSTQNVSVAATAASTAPFTLIRGEPTVFSGGKASLRVWSQRAAGETISSVSWQQLSGAAATIDTQDTDRERLIFTAPQTSGDIALKFRATVKLSSGREDSSEYTVLVLGLPGTPANQLFRDYYSASRVYAYRRASPHASALEACVFTPDLTYGNNTNLCLLQRLPLLGTETRGAIPTIDQIMDRVVVSNDWMGEVFREFLLTHDSSGDLRRQFNATTAIVIGGRVRPAFYWSTTGAIYLDAGYFWSTPEQRDTVTEVPDYRSAFGQDLKFITPYRYVVGNNYASASYPVTARQTRPVAELIYEAGRLLYHELAHANDFLNPSLHGSLNGSLRVEQSVPAAVTSNRLFGSLPYQSQEMLGLARVLFHGVSANATQLAYTPADVAGFFSRDRVNDDYAYSVPPNVNPPVSYEDTAMMVEEFWMAHRHGVRRDWAVTNSLSGNQTARDAIVSWGQRGRIAAPEVRARLKLVMAELSPWVSMSAIDALPAPINMRPGEDWIANLNLQPGVMAMPRSFSQQRALDEDATRSLREQLSDKAHHGGPGPGR
jgi:hypothetical protein